MVAGSLGVVIIVSLALTLQVVQAMLPPSPLLWSLSGITGIDYGFIAVGWWRKYKAVMTPAVESRTAEYPNTGALQEPPPSDEQQSSLDEQQGGSYAG